MRSYDLFGTLVAGRNPAVRDGDQDSHFPIAENIAKVRRGDLIISDFYDPDKAQRILKDVAKLDNNLIVSHDGKATGAVWQQLQACGQTPELHLGDDPLTDYASPKNHKIRCELTALTVSTPLEIQVAERGFPGLSRLMREARLATWHEDKTMRELQLFQTQINLPFLFLASILVHRQAVKTRRRQVLMSARDCWLWSHLFGAMWDHHFIEPSYSIDYFLTSRLTRYFPSENYIRYCKKLMKLPALAVDLCGFGRSLFLLLDSTEIDLLLLVGYDPCEVPCLIPGWMNETTNFARHPMIADVDEAGNPVYANPLNVDWERIPELEVMHGAFLRGVEAVREYQFVQDFGHADEHVLEALKAMFAHFDDYSMALGTLTGFRVQEAQATAELINSRGAVQGVVV